MFGHYDLIIPVEAKTLPELSDHIEHIASGPGVSHTISYIASAPDFSNPDRFPVDQLQAVLLINVEPKMKAEVRKNISNECDVADIVFGDVDIIAVFHKNETFWSTLTRIIDQNPGITKTTTLLPVDLSNRVG